MKYYGINTSSLLGIAFIVLKLTNCIDWSWLLVLAPFWIPWSIAGVILILGLIIMVIGAVIEKIEDME